MPAEWLATGLALVIVLTVCNLVLLLRQAGPRRDDAEAIRADLDAAARELGQAQRVEADSVRASLANTERALSTRAEQSRLEAHAMLGGISTAIAKEQGEQRVLIEAKLREMSEQAAQRLGDIQRSVNERLTDAIDKQMTGSFQRVIDQFAAVQKAMGDVQAVTAQVGDLKRLFTNVKTRGGWGETQLRALLEDALPHGAWEANRKLRADTDEVVEFVLLMPARSTPRPVLAIDAKFPAEDYDRVLLAAEAGDNEAERTARRALETRLRSEAKKIGSKYIVPPVTVDFAVMYLPTDGLYVEASRMPGLIEALNRECRVILMGPSLLPALLRTIQLGALTLSIEQRAEEIQRLLGAVRGEMEKMDDLLARIEKQSGTIGNTIGQARRRTRAVQRTLRSVTALGPEESEAAFALEEESSPEATR